MAQQAKVWPSTQQIFRLVVGRTPGCTHPGLLHR